jgi:hypothetical protein
LHDRATGLARDATGLIALHYTDGILAGDAWLPLPELEYMRDLERDDDGTLWVAGWHGIAQLRPDGNGWLKKVFRLV